MHGKIYRTTTAYLTKFKKQVPPIFPTSEDIAMELGTIEGLWPEGIRINGKEAFSFVKILPYEMEGVNHPLPSDSRLRNDLSYYISGDIDLAQEHKETQEQVQRRDRKLREKYNL